MKFHENPYSLILVTPKRLTETLGHDKGGFSNFSHGVNKNEHTVSTHKRHCHIPLLEVLFNCSYLYSCLYKWQRFHRAGWSCE
jgi:hypothetical protein